MDMGMMKMGMMGMEEVPASEEDVDYIVVWKGCYHNDLITNTKWIM